MIDEQAVKDRVSARQDVATLLLLALVSNRSVAYQAEFWKVLHAECLKHIIGAEPLRQDAKVNKPMDSLERKAFGKRTMPYGQFRDTAIDNIDLRNLEWYIDKYEENREFFADMRRYLDACEQDEVSEKPWWIHE